MSWGKRPGGGMYGPVKDVDDYGRSKGLPKHWYSKKKQKWANRRKEIHKGNFWDVMDNPLYQVAAEAKGYDWDDWVKEAKGKVGHGPGDWVRAEVKAGSTSTRTVHTGGHPDGRSGPSVTQQSYSIPAEYEWMPKEEAEDKDLPYTEGPTERWLNKETGEMHYFPEINPQGGGDKIDGDTWKELRDWGIHDFEIAEDLDVMGKWLNDIVSINDHLPKIIREGPKGEHYGIEGDIWEHYGLDKEPEPPKELDWDSAEKDMKLKTAVTSHVTYSTPEGLDPIDLHSD